MRPWPEAKTADEARHAAALLKETEELDFNDLAGPIVYSLHTHTHASVRIFAIP